MLASEFPQARWRKACHANNTCVEVAEDGRTVLVRDGKDPDGPVLRFDRARWRRFAKAAKASR